MVTFAIFDSFNELPLMILIKRLSRVSDLDIGEQCGHRKWSISKTVGILEFVLHGF